MDISRGALNRAESDFGPPKHRCSPSKKPAISCCKTHHLGLKSLQHNTDIVVLFQRRHLSEFRALIYRGLEVRPVADTLDPLGPPAPPG